LTIPTEPRQRPRRRRRRRRFSWRALLAIVVVVCVFAAGVALGEALHDNPNSGGTTTSERTLRPLPLVPQTVTVTVRGSG
jgi:ferric-dicitrate binding protein FerR (iron transport regulator)